MENIEISDPLFRAAVTALDEGETATLKQLLQDNSRLAGVRLDKPTEGYFKYPYLLWFIADNPIRRGRLHPNIPTIATVVIDAIRRDAPDSLQQQIDYALGLVATGRIPRECGIQAQLIDILIDAGAKPGKGIGALGHGNTEAARQLIARGGGMTLAAAAGLGMEAEMIRLLPQASREEKQLALVVAAFYGRSSMLPLLMTPDIDLNSYPPANGGFHTHATALHQAVWSGSLETVKLLVEAGADTSATDRVYKGTPLGWALYAQTEDEMSDEQKASYALIADYLQQKE